MYMDEWNLNDHITDPLNIILMEMDNIGLLDENMNNCNC